MAPKKDTELDAMQKVSDALEELEEAARVRVINWVIQKLSINVPQVATNISTAAAIVTQNRQQLPAGISIKDFVASKRPQNTYQRLACLAYFLEKNEAKIEFKARDLTDANTRARQPKITNITVFVNDATRKYGFLA